MPQIYFVFPVSALTLQNPRPAVIGVWGSLQAGLCSLSCRWLWQLFLGKLCLSYSFFTAASQTSLLLLPLGQVLVSLQHFLCLSRASPSARECPMVCGRTQTAVRRGKAAAGFFPGWTAEQETTLLPSSISCESQSSSQQPRAINAINTINPHLPHSAAAPGDAAPVPDIEEGLCGWTVPLHLGWRRNI